MGDTFVVAVADTGRPLLWNLSRSPKWATPLLSRSPIPAAPYSEICRGRRKGRQFVVACRHFCERRPRQNLFFCRGSPVFFFFTGRNANVTVFVVEQRVNFLSISPISVNYITHRWKWNTFNPPSLPHPTQEKFWLQDFSRSFQVFQRHFF